MALLVDLHMRRSLQIFTIIAYLLRMVINLLSSIGVLGYGTIGEISNKYPTMITPAGYAFSVWFVIFSLQALYCIYILMPRSATDGYVRAFSFFLPAAWVCEAAWIFAFVYEVIILSLVLMLLIWFFLVFSYLRLAALEPDTYTCESGFTGLLKYISQKLVLSVSATIYFAWITAATLINVMIVMSVTEPHPTTGSGVALLCIAANTALLLLIIRKDITFAVVIIWALVAIAVKQKEIVEIEVCCRVCITLLMFCCGVILCKTLYKTGTRPPTQTEYRPPTPQQLRFLH